MLFFGHKRHRHSRTLSIHTPETTWSRLFGRLGERSVLGRVLLCLGAIALLLVGVQSWNAPFPYRRGQRVAHGIAAKTDFSVVNEADTRRLREDARARAPFVFRNHPERLGALILRFRAALGAVQQAESIADLPEDVRSAFGLEAGAAEEPTPIEEQRELFNQLKAAVSKNGQKEARERIEDLVDNFSKFISPLSATGVISPDDVRRLSIRSDSTIRVVNAAADDESAAGPQAQEVALSKVLLADQLSDVGDLGSKWELYIHLREIRVPFALWLGSQVPVTLEYDQQATIAEQSAAEQSVEDVRDPYKVGDLLVAPNEPISEEKLGLLQAEYRVAEEDVSATERSVRVAVIFGMLAVLAGLNGFYVVRNEPQLVRSLARLTGYLLAVVVAIVLGHYMSYDPLRAEIIPLTAAVMILAIAYNQVLATLTALTLSLVITVATTAQLSQFVVLLSTAAMALLPLGRVSSRTTLIKSGFLASLTYLLVSCGISIIQTQSVMDVVLDTGFLIQSLKGAALCLLAGYLVAGSLPFIESAFGVVTDISLLEMSDPSHPLLQELVRRAPGTYNHSISVASIGEAAAESIGANGLLVRVGAYFHDIGKMLKPQYFVENVEAGSRSRHEHLAPAMSTLIIIGHVKDGVDLAEHYNLPQQLIDFIEQHHGTTLVEYFYHEATKQAEVSPDHKADAEESAFRYPGPKPQTQEAGVMMLADAVESASRALSDPTPKRLETLVHEITMKRLMDGQFEECALTLSQLRCVERTLTKSLIGIYHGRIKYPEVRTA